MKRYRTARREGIVAKILEAVEASGGKVVRKPDPTSAPYELLIQTPAGELVDLVCYAFTANKYRQGGRPEGEHRFQVKYGSDFKRYHHLFIDPDRTRITLMFGVHVERDLFIAVDPRMHNPTWFSASVEVKEDQLDEAQAKGWNGWERDRAEGRRKREMPELDLRTECVIAFRPEQFLRYVMFERIASGAECGERLSLSDSVEIDIKSGKPPASNSPLTAHRLEELLGLSANEVLEVIDGRFRLMAAVRGGVAEHHLGKLLAKVPGVSGLERIDKDGEPDFRLIYRDVPIRLECKNVLARLVGGKPKVDFQRTRNSKDDPCSRYYKRSEFDVLAACTHPISGTWSFTFRPTATMQAHPQCVGRLAQNVPVNGDGWFPAAVDVLDELRAAT